MAVCVTVAVFVWVTVADCVTPGRVAVGLSDAVPLVGVGDAAGVSLGTSLGLSTGLSLGRVTVGSVRLGAAALVGVVRDTEVGSVTEPPPVHPVDATTTSAAMAPTRRTWRPMSDCAVRRAPPRVTLPG